MGSPPVGRPRAAPQPVPSRWCRAQRSPPCLSLCCCNKRIRVCSFLFGSCLNGPAAPGSSPGGPAPAVQPTGGLWATAPTLGSGSRTWTPCVRLCLQAPGRGGASGCQLWSGGWVPPKLCIPAHLLPRPHLGGAGRSSQGHRLALTHTAVVVRGALPSPGALSPWQRDSAHSPPRSTPRQPPQPLLWGECVETRAPAARPDSRVQHSQPADPDRTRKAWGSRSNSGQCAPIGSRKAPRGQLPGPLLRGPRSPSAPPHRTYFGQKGH